MGVCRLPANVTRIPLWNLLGKYDGHYTVWTQGTSKFVFGKHGDYGNLISYKEIPHPTVEIPTEEDKTFFEPLIAREQRFYRNNIIEFNPDYHTLDEADLIAYSILFQIPKPEFQSLCQRIGIPYQTP